MVDLVRPTRPSDFAVALPFYGLYMSKLSLDVLFQGNDKLSATLEKMSGNARKLEGNLGDLKGKIAQLSGLKVRLDGLEKTKKETAEAATKLTAYKKVIKDLQAQMDAGNTDKGIAKRLKDAEKEAAKLQNTVNKGRAKISGLASSLESAGYKGQSFAQSQDQIEKELNQATAAMEKQQKRLKSLSDTQKSVDKMTAARDKAAGVAVGAGAVVAGLGTAVKTYADSENAEMELKVSMMTNKGEVAKEYNDMIALANKLGTKLPGTTADFHNMMATLVQQGINAKAILGGVGEATGYLAVQMKLPFAEAAEFAAKLQDATKTTEKDMLSLMDVIQRSYYLGVDKTNMLSGFSKMAAGMKTVRMEGLEGAKALAPLLIMADQASMSGEAAGNAYSKIFKSMMDSIAINKALDGTGIQMDFTDGNGEFGGIDNMFAQLEKLKGLSTEQRLSVLSDAFGNDSETTQALNLLIDKGKAGYEETVAKMQSQADLQTRVNAQLGTLTNVWDTAKAGAESIWGKVGEALAPALKDMSLWISSVTEKISAWISENPALFAAITKIVAGIAAFVAIAATAVVTLTSILLPIAALKMSILSLSGSFGLIGKALGVFGKFKAVFGVVVGGLGKLGGAIKSIPTLLSLVRTGFMMAAGGVKAFSVALLTNPVTWVVAGIAAATFVIYKYWNPIKAFFAGVWDGIKAAAEPIMLIFEAVGNAIKPVVDWLGRFFDTTQVGEGNARSLGQTVGGFLAKAFLLLTAPVRTAWNVLKGVWENIKGLFSGEISVGDIFAGLWAKFDGAVAKITEWKDRAAKLWDDFWSVFKSNKPDAGAGVGPGGSTGGGGFWSSLANGFETAKNTISEKAGSMWESAKSKFDTAKATLSAKAGEIWSAVTNAMGGGGGADIGTTINTKVQAILVAISAAAAAISATFTALLGVVSASVIDIITVIGTAFAGVPVIVAAAMAGVPAVFAVSLSVLPAITASVFSALAVAIGAGMAVIATVVTARMTAVAAVLQAGFARIRQAVATAWRQLGSAMSGNPILTRIQAAMNATLGYLNGIKWRFTAIGADIAGGLAAGMNSRLGELRKTAAQMAAVVEDASRKRLDTHSPSRVMAAVGRDVVAGLDVGMSRRFAPMLKNFSNNIGKLANPANLSKVVNMADNIGAMMGSDDVVGDLMKMVAPSFSHSMLGNVFEIGAQAVTALARTQPKPIAVTPLKSASAMTAEAIQNSTQNSASSSNVSINVQASPGMDERTLAMRVREELEKFQAKSAARHRARLTD